MPVYYASLQIITKEACDIGYAFYGIDDNRVCLIGSGQLLLNLLFHGGIDLVHDVLHSTDMYGIRYMNDIPYWPPPPQ